MTFNWKCFENVRIHCINNARIEVFFDPHCYVQGQNLLRENKCQKNPVFWPILRSDKECSIRSRSSTFALLVNTKSLAWFPSNSIILSLCNLNTDQQKLLWISVGIKILIDSKEMKMNGSKRRRKIVKDHIFSNCRCRHLLMLLVVFKTFNFAIS